MVIVNAQAIRTPILLTAPVDITLNSLPSVNAGSDQIICEGDQVTLKEISSQFNNALILKGVLDLHGSGNPVYSGTDVNLKLVKVKF